MPDEPLIIDPDEPVVEEENNQEELIAPGERAVVISSDILPDSLLLVPTFNRPLFPKMIGPVLIDDEITKNTLVEAMQAARPYFGLLLVRMDEDDPVPIVPAAAEDFYKIGVAVKVLQASPPQENMPLQLLVQALERFEIVEFLPADPPIFKARVKYWHETEFVNNDELKAYSIAIIDSIRELVNLNPLLKESLSLLLDRVNVNDPGALSDLSASMTSVSGAELQQVLEERSIRARVEMALLMLKKEIEIGKLKVQINKRIEERLSKQQREFFLREQLKEIKQELGLTKDDREAEIEKFQKRLAPLKVSAEAQTRIDEELEKMRLLEPSSAEFNVSRAYLDWLTALPWGQCTEDNYDIKRAAEVLDEAHYGLQDVKDRILELISVGIIKGDLAGSIILLVGPPGVGKTSIGQSIATALGRKFYRFSLGGMRDEAEIKGHRRTYIGALPGKVIQAIKTAESANPLIMLDEIDKIGASFRGDPASALLEVLDPEQNRDFLDHYLDVRFDLSKVLFVCTANQLDTIPGPLLDRMEVIRLAGYILEEKLEIAKRHLLPKQLKFHGLTTDQIDISDEVLREMIDGYSREAGVRSLENNIKKVLRKSAKQIVEREVPTVEIQVDDLRELLGRRLFSEEKLYQTPRVGVVMGLAYTTLGGATLYIEATPLPAKGSGFKQTGQLGKVMIESSEIAYTYVRSLLRDDEERTAFFTDNFIHLHVPAGATPKDGPSAGITMACAIYSLAVNRPIIENLAMTGELSLTGLVMPIGGVKEKTIAARRAGVTTLIFPTENRQDFEDLDDHIREGLATHFVSTFEEVLAVGFPEAEYLDRLDLPRVTNP